MEFRTERLILRSWKESDAESLFEYSKDLAIGPIAGWPPHKSIDESRDVIKHVFCGRECYAVCLKTDNRAIGCIELKLNGNSDLTKKEDECELGYWIGKEFWGQGLIPEAARELIRHAFENLHMNIIWCGYYDGNTKSKRVQEKVGFVYHHTCEEVLVPLMGESRIGHTNYLTKEKWLANM
jgi:RimJ/RimL family protein N-acetyltransferase